MELACKILPWLFAAAYAFAFAVFMVGTFGWLGADQGPLAGVFLMPLGMPWVFLVDVLPEKLWAIAGALAPAINLGLLFWLCRSLRNL